MQTEALIGILIVIASFAFIECATACSACATVTRRHPAAWGGVGGDGKRTLPQ